jgi:hypothetical protein
MSYDLNGWGPRAHISWAMWPALSSKLDKPALEIIKSLNYWTGPDIKKNIAHNQQLEVKFQEKYTKGSSDKHHYWQGICRLGLNFLFQNHLGVVGLSIFYFYFYSSDLVLNFLNCCMCCSQFSLYFQTARTGTVVVTSYKEFFGMYLPNLLLTELQRREL